MKANYNNKKQFTLEGEHSITELVLNTIPGVEWQKKAFNTLKAIHIGAMWLWPNAKAVVTKISEDRVSVKVANIWKRGKKMKETREQFFEVVDKYYKEAKATKWADKKALLEKYLVNYEESCQQNRIKWTKELLAAPVFSFEELL